MTTFNRIAKLMQNLQITHNFIIKKKKKIITQYMLTVYVDCKQPLLSCFVKKIHNNNSCFNISQQIALVLGSIGWPWLITTYSTWNISCNLLDTIHLKQSYILRQKEAYSQNYTFLMAVMFMASYYHLIWLYCIFLVYIK